MNCSSRTYHFLNLSLLEVCTLRFVHHLRPPSATQGEGNRLPPSLPSLPPLAPLAPLPSLLLPPTPSPLGHEAVPHLYVLSQVVSFINAEATLIPHLLWELL